ncbi:MAG: SMC-Scp complex subunit ScpB [Alphaproteobacteria bacterium]|nr:SMC-Scp complex subunit ScpB [Alphaproteobacteria bacterium]MCD8526270.1 SMC-Scp complex subunit ScpB [Alphaproteobacteria bacterium]MCD8571117.1 SMC-Scp complex subunit ScpB [Alphaproteobacteria bacterium]
MDQDQKRIVEAMLFAAAEPLSPKALYDRLGEEADVGAILKSLQQDYDGRGVNLIEMDGVWAFRTASDLAGALGLQKQEVRKLSRAALETLAIVAYHQPVTRAEIENIRGVAIHKGTLDTLVEAGWVKPGRRRETLGRPLTWITTTAFLDHFGLESMMDLPGLDELKASGLLDRRPAIDALPDSPDLFQDQEEDETEIANDDDFENSFAEEEEKAAS